MLTKYAANIYNKTCPHCHRGNIETAVFCWNCGYEFEDTIVYSRIKELRKNFWASLGVQIAFIVGIIVLILIILDAAK